MTNFSIPLKLKRIKRPVRTKTLFKVLFAVCAGRLRSSNFMVDFFIKILEIFMCKLLLVMTFKHDELHCLLVAPYTLYVGNANGKKNQTYTFS